MAEHTRFFPPLCLAFLGCSLRFPFLCLHFLLSVSPPSRPLSPCARAAEGLVVTPPTHMCCSVSEGTCAVIAEHPHCRPAALTAQVGLHLLLKDLGSVTQLVNRQQTAGRIMHCRNHRQGVRTCGLPAELRAAVAMVVPHPPTRLQTPAAALSVPCFEVGVEQKLAQACQ